LFSEKFHEIDLRIEAKTQDLISKSLYQFAQGDKNPLALLQSPGQGGFRPRQNMAKCLGHCHPDWGDADPGPP